MLILDNWKEDTLFEWIKDNVYEDLVKCKNPVSRWDCYSPKYNHRIELKCRTKHYDTLMLEKKKYNSMVEASKRHLDIPIYINSTPNGIYFFNLFKVDLNWENCFVRKTTHFTNNNRINKEVAYLDLSQGLKLL